MILVDTSAWIDFFRGKVGRISADVDRSIEDNEAALCGPVEAELRRGLVGRERATVVSLLEGCHQLATPLDLWRVAGDLGWQLARKGVTAKTVDLLITVYALVHDVPVLTNDKDFQAMRKAGVPLVLL